MKSYLIIDMRTGLMDGWYTDSQWARDALQSLNQRFPDGEWVLVELMDVAETDGRPSLPDHLFHGYHKSKLRVN